MYWCGGYEEKRVVRMDVKNYQEFHSMGMGNIPTCTGILHEYV